MFKKLLQSVREAKARKRERAEAARLQKEKAKRWTRYFRASESIR